MIGGDRNFVTDRAQYESWHPGGSVLDAWSDLLGTIRAGNSGELEEHTFRRSGASRDGSRWWISETLDFARIGCDFLRHAHRQQYVHVVRAIAHQHASDHLPIAITFDKRTRPNNKKRLIPHVSKPMPDWLAYDADFLRSFLPMSKAGV